jgi:hypothetical protein
MGRMDVTFGDVKVSMADAAMAELDTNLPRTGFW